MNLFIIRHAPTEANLSGDLVKNYDSFDIIAFDTEKWWSKVGQFLPKDGEYEIFCSPAKRCINTAKFIFPDKNVIVTPKLSEFDCSGLVGKKFWEISEQEFDECSGLNKNNMNIRISDAIVETMGTDIREFLKSKKTNYRNIIWVTHGLFGRTTYSFYNHTTDTPYELINSKNIQFKNLDMMKIEPSTGKTEIYRF